MIKFQRMKDTHLFLTNINKHYKMFFLITNIAIGKYYSKFFTQFIIGCVCYILAFFILKDFIASGTYQKYKCHIFFLVAIDAAFLVYRSKSQNVKTEDFKEDKLVAHTNEQENSTTEGKSLSPSSINISEEINDFKIMHDISISSDNYSLFSTSDDKNDNEKEEDKKDETTTPTG